MKRFTKRSAVVASVAALSIPAIGQMSQQNQPQSPSTQQPTTMNQPGTPNQTGAANQPGMNTQTAPNQTAQPGATTANASSNILETTAQAGQFNTFNRAVEAAGLAETLRGPGPITVFAPTDEAFQQLPQGKLDELLKPENKSKLQELLQAHIVSGRVKSSEVTSMDSAKTLSGEDLSIQASGSSVRIGEATVTRPDMSASNGIIHAVDKLVKPIE